MPPYSLTVLDRLERGLVRTLMKLPHRAKLWLSGRRAITVEGETLHPEIQLMLALRALTGMTTLAKHGPTELSRAVVRRDAFVHRGDEVAVGQVRELTVDGATGPLQARLYTPEGAAAKTPLLLFFHGGGFVICDLDTHDSACRVLCRDARVRVLSVEYRLAPEHPFPAAAEDACAALQYTFSHAAQLGADPARIVIGGDSAGGNLATVAARLAAQRGEAVPCMQLLIYPTVDRKTARKSIDLFKKGFFLTRRDMDWFQQLTCGSELQLEHPWISPLLWDVWTNVPPALVVTATFDPLRDEGEAYAEALERAGAATRLIRVPGMIHGFINMVGTSRAALAALSEIALAMREFLDTRVHAPARAPEESVRASA